MFEALGGEAAALERASSGLPVDGPGPRSEEPLNGVWSRPAEEERARGRRVVKASRRKEKSTLLVKSAFPGSSSGSASLCCRNACAVHQPSSYELSVEVSIP